MNDAKCKKKKKKQKKAKHISKKSYTIKSEPIENSSEGYVAAGMYFFLFINVCLFYIIQLDVQLQ